MSIFIKRSDLKVKNPDTGTYQGQSLFTENDTQTQLTQINNAGVTQINAINTKGQQTINSIPNDYTELSYSVDDLKSEYFVPEWNHGKYITTSGSSVDITTMNTSSSYQCAVIPCIEGDVFEISGTGSSAARLWAFIQNDGTTITQTLTTVTELKTLVAAPPNSSYLVINVNINYDFSVEKIEKIKNETNRSVLDTSAPNMFVAKEFNVGYWVDGTGVTAPANMYKMSKGFWRADPNSYYKTNVSSGFFRLICYDSHMNFLGKSTVYSVDYPKITPTLPNTKWVRLLINTNVSDPSSVTVTRINASETNVIEYPSVDDNIIVLPNTAISSSGAIQTEVSGYHLAIVPNISGEKIYASYNGNNACIFYDATGSKITVDTPAQCTPIGTLTTIPANASIAFINLKVTVDGEGGWYTVILKNGYKKVLVIGDSIAWLDGRTNTTSAFAGTMKGFQAVMRKAGYLVDTLAYSGRPYAQYEGSAESETDTESFEDSIFERIVTNQADVSSYDYIILFGGHNDIRLDIPLGSEPTTYAEMSATFDSETFYGALSAIIKYCRDNNPNAQIILWTVTQTESVSRPYLKTKTYRDAEITLSLLWGIPYVDMFSILNFTPFINYKSATNTGTTGFHYDTSHPNYIGMKRIGEIGLKELKLY